jgi:hypothetical protein
VDVGDGGLDPSADDAHRRRPGIRAHQNGSTTMKRASGRACLRRVKSASVRPSAMITMSGCCLMMRSGRSPWPKNEQLRMKQRPLLWLGLNSRQP